MIEDGIYLLFNEHALGLLSHIIMNKYNYFAEHLKNITNKF